LTLFRNPPSIENSNEINSFRGAANVLRVTTKRVDLKADGRSPGSHSSPMSQPKDPRRIRERLELKLPVRVRCRETIASEWEEVTRLTDVTPFGAGFTLKRPTEKGRLLHMTIPLPRQLRVFDHVEDQYRIWALVRHVRSIVGPDKSNRFQVGVAFIGKQAPASYEKDPARRYELSTPGEDELPTVEELSRSEKTSGEQSHTVHSIAIDMLVEALNDEGEVIQSEPSVTQDISRTAATLFTTMHIALGRFVRVTSNQYKITAHAVVRGRSTGADGIRRIHVEFIDKEWPL